MRQTAPYDRFGGFHLAGSAILCLAVCGLLSRSTLTAAEPKAKKARAKKEDGGEWKSLFDGKTIAPWEVVTKYMFRNHGKVYVKDGCLRLDEGNPATGIRWPGEFPKMDYELTLEGKKVEGYDFSCGLTFPVGDKALTLILGGWGGGLMGLSNIDNSRADENETGQPIDIKNGVWYHLRLRVTKTKIEVWVDDESMVEFETTDREFGIDWDMEICQPLGIANWSTTSEFRSLRYRSLAEDVGGDKKQAKK